MPNDSLALFLGFLVDLLDIFEAEPRIVRFAVGNLDMLGEKDRVLDAHAGTVEIGGKFGLFEKFGRRLIPAGTQLVCDLLGAAFLFKEFAFYFRRTALGLGRS